MVSIHQVPPVAERLLKPLHRFLQSASHRFRCHKLSDEDWLATGIYRVLEDEPSGCGFLQKLQLNYSRNLRKNHYFQSLGSTRRLAHLRELCRRFTSDLAQRALDEDPEAGLCEELKNFHLYAGDGHFHAASSHDPRDEDGSKHAIGHLYALNLRNQCLSHLALSSKGGRTKPHDMGTLKSTEIATLRQGAGKGQKVLYVWDRAGIDFPQWMKWKHGSGIYFLSRVKENMRLEIQGECPIDRDDPRNAGVLADQLVAGLAGVLLRRIRFLIPETGEEMEFLTNLGPGVPPGVVAQLYFMRWRIEKSFDELKNKLYERKAWATSDTAKTMQGLFIVLAYNLAKLLHARIQRDHHIEDTITARKRQQRCDELEASLEKQGRRLPSLRRALQTPSQLGVKYYRWLRLALYQATCWEESLDQLRALYADY